MTRAEALAWLIERFTNVYVKAGMVTTDTAPAGFKAALDDTWDYLDVAVSEPLAVGDVKQARAILKYLALWYACQYLVTRYSKSLSGVSLQTYQVFQGVQAMLAQALKEAQAYGYNSAGHASYGEIVLRPARAASSLSPSTLWTEMGLPD